MERWLLVCAVVVCVAGATVAMTYDPERPSDPADGPSTSVAPPSTSSTTTSTTEPPGPFGPLPERADVPAVQTPAGFVLPVLGGAPGAWRVRTPCAAEAVVPGDPVRGAHVVLDPGHGGSEPGAVGPSGQTEKDVNLDVARRVADLLRAEGATVVLTRDRDVRVTIETRTAIANALDPLAFLSIHHNAAPLASAPAPGSELYHQLAGPESKRLAGLLWEELQVGLSPFADDWAVGESGVRARQSVRSGDDFYGVLRRAEEVPAVLTESVFLSDPEEDALLATEEFRQAEAVAITRAVVRFVTSDDPGSGFVPTKVSDTPAGGGGGSAGCEDPPLA